MDSTGGEDTGIMSALQRARAEEAASIKVRTMEF